MQNETAPTSASYEVGVQREMLVMARRYGRLQAAIDTALSRLEAVILPAVTDKRRKEKLIELIADLRRANDAPSDLAKGEEGL